MEQNRNMEQCGTAAAVPTEKKNENRKREVSGQTHKSSAHSWRM